MAKKYLITSALPYINGVKHLGNLIGSMLPADVYARFLRQEGHEVLYVCGTDEHGTPAELAAQEADAPIERYCQDMHELQKRIYEGFDIAFDFFGRSSSSSNHEFTTSVFKDLYVQGFIEEKYIKQYYSFDDQRFLPDRYVEGTCPRCGYARARGDQCDGCGVLLDPEELLNPYSAISRSLNIALQETKHYFLNLPKIEGELLVWIEQQKNWSDIVKGIEKKWISEGLQARCITRDLKWGIRVPLEWITDQKALKGEGAEENIGEKVFYVWFDAPNAYVSITQDWAKTDKDAEAWKAWWLPKKQDDVFYVQFMAKDNVPFHAVFWPGILLGTCKPYKMVDDIKGFHWLTYDKGKFSTSLKRGIFTDTALELYPADYWRYYLLANCPESADSDFTFESFAATVNKDLADILGNFANRTLVLLEKYFDLKVPAALSEKTLDAGLVSKCQSLITEIAQALEARRFRAAMTALRSLWVLGNGYITEKEPWHVLKTDKDGGGIILTHCVHLLRIFALASAPFIPATSQKIFGLLQENVDRTQLVPISKAVDFQYFSEGHRLQKGDDFLFAKIDPSVVQSLTQLYAGQE
ncbi:methionine--tRNA ligase [Alphaproteobacteria bacterium]|nr:methionine--tRNA ligase [Alphaproteobacteria bacterium]GHS96151.1 methionine--tRNA ligase [Alphaproteobacteria bacterium]